MEQPARTAPVEGFSVRKRVACLQTIEKSVESSRSSPETGAGEGIESPLPLQSPDTDQRNIYPEERHAGTAETARRHPP